MRTYGTNNLTETSPEQSFDEPLALEEVKKYLELPERSPTDPMEDEQIDGFISAARDFAEFLQGRDLVRKQYDLSLDYFPCREIELGDPLISVDLFEYTDYNDITLALAANTDYYVDTTRHPGVIMPAYGKSWPSFTPRVSGAVLIRHTRGYSPSSSFWTRSEGRRIKVGMLMLISGWFNNRIPFAELGNQAIQEYPFAITTCLGWGGRVRAR
jgi:hypothetical protein